MNNDLEAQLLALFEEWAGSKSWWHAEDATLVAFYKWLKVRGETSNKGQEEA